MKLNDILESDNIAADLDEDQLVKIGMDCADGFRADKESRTAWEDRNEEWLKLALQTIETKSFPWPNSANIKYPLITVASLQFSARAYPAIVNGFDVVKGKVIGFDPDGQKAEKAIRIGKHMSYQLMAEMSNWDEEMDKLCFALPIVGCMFKKTYYNPLTEKNCSDLIYPKHLLVNYYAKDLNTASRISHWIEMYPNEVKERQMANIFLSVDLPRSSPSQEDSNSKTSDRIGLNAPRSDEDAPYNIIEQHCYLDLDEDDYKEPYIVTFELESKKVLRIIPRFDQEDVKYNVDGSMRYIVPQQYFTKFSFIPNPDGGFYDVGFGILLGPINETVNTILNQLIDSGTLANMQGGFLGRGVRLKSGDTSFRLGEWKPVNATGDDIRKSIFPLPTKEPSSVLFQLLGMLNEVGKEISSVSETMTGKMPGQNTPATTTMATIEQGLKVFTAIHKRIYRSLEKEYKLLYKLNGKHLGAEEEFNILGTPSGGVVYQNDYQDSKVDVLPAADPNVATESQKLAKAQGLLELMQTGLINPQVAVKRILEAQNQPAVEELMNVPQKGPGLEEQQLQFEQSKFQWQQQREQAELLLNKAAQDYENQLKESNAMLAMAKAQSESMGQQLEVLKLKLDTFMANKEFEHSRRLDIADHIAGREDAFSQRKFQDNQLAQQQQQIQQQPQGSTTE